MVRRRKKPPPSASSSDSALDPRLENERAWREAKRRAGYAGWLARSNVARTTTAIWRELNKAEERAREEAERMVRPFLPRDESPTSPPDRPDGEFHSEKNRSVTVMKSSKKSRKKKRNDRGPKSRGRPTKLRKFDRPRNAKQTKARAMSRDEEE
jgi:hypothetical protein